MKRVIIIGGGYAGTQLARALDSDADVALIEPREAFVHNVGAIRAVVDPALLDSLILPYDRLLKRGRIVRDRAVAIKGTTVELQSGKSLSGDVVVIATGSTYAAPFKPVDDQMSAFRQASDALHKQLASARRVAIIGAGAVGVELAGEIAAAMPGKQVDLVSANSSLFPEFNPGLGERLGRELEWMGVTLNLGATAQSFDPQRSLGGTVKLSNGTSLNADLIVPALGARPASQIAASLPQAALDKLGRIAVDPWLRVGDSKAVFALGDVAACGDMMTIVAVSRQAPWLAKTIKAMLNGKPIEQLPAYTPWPNPPILIPLGPKRGASVLPISKRGLVVGDTLTSAIKGKKLFVPRYHKEFRTSGTGAA
jgi:NADH dehydrogenase FAD-containing subunit